MKVLQTVPSLIREVDGGNPDVMRALPLSWDALLISGALMFLLGQLQIYRRLRTAASTCSDQLPPEASVCVSVPACLRLCLCVRRHDTAVRSAAGCPIEDVFAPIRPPVDPWVPPPPWARLPSFT